VIPPRGGILQRLFLLKSQHVYRNNHLGLPPAAKIQDKAWPRAGFRLHHEANWATPPIVRLLRLPEIARRSRPNTSRQARIPSIRLPASRIVNRPSPWFEDMETAGLIGPETVLVETEPPGIPASPLAFVAHHAAIGLILV